ncbi:MAG: Uma2 family endonuclease [Gemmataceae bacterium]|nr:Uma2 family endonuclease [Gemmataceae bacterium]
MRAVIAEMPRRWLAEHKASEAAQWDEVWNGVLHMPPMPNRLHQRFERDLLIHLQTHWGDPRGCQVDQQVNLTTPEDEGDWVHNYRIPDLVLLTPDRFHIDRGEYMAGAPLVVVEVRSPRDETDEKFPFYAGLGVPEVWVFDRDTKAPALHTLIGPTYQPVAADADGWHRSPATGIEFRPGGPGRLTVRIGGNDATATDLPRHAPTTG